MTLHREMNRLFDDMFRGFGGTPFSQPRAFVGGGWPNIEVSETEKEVKVCAELPGLEEKDINVELMNGILCIKGEKKTETEDKDRLFSERYYGRFERRIPVDEVEEDKASASFKKRRPDHHATEVGQSSGERQAHRDKQIRASRVLYSGGWLSSIM